MAIRKPTLWIVIVLAALALLSLRSILHWERRRHSDIAAGQVRSSFDLKSSSFTDGDPIPQKFTCDGANISPDIQLPSPTAPTKSFAIVMDDPDASGFVHWIVYNIPPDVRDIAEAASSQANLPQGATEGVNDFGNTNYGGPCPPGKKSHHYLLRLYALDISTNLPPGQTRKQLAAALKGHIVAEGQITGLYTRSH